MKCAPWLSLLVLTCALSCSSVAPKAFEWAQHEMAGHYLEGDLNAGGVAVGNLDGFATRSKAGATVGVLRVLPDQEGPDTDGNPVKPKTEVLWSERAEVGGIQGWQLVVDHSEKGKWLKLLRLTCAETVARYPSLGDCPTIASPAIKERVAWSVQLE